MSEGKVAVITAGGRGIGAAIARELHAEGYRLALMSPSGSAKVLADELGGLGVTGSVMEPDDLKRLVDEALAAHRCGRQPHRPSAQGGAPRHPRRGLAPWSRHDAPAGGPDGPPGEPSMLALGGGAIVNITTFAAFEPVLNLPVSSCIRAAIDDINGSPVVHTWSYELNEAT